MKTMDVVAKMAREAEKMAVAQPDSLLATCQRKTPSGRAASTYLAAGGADLWMEKLSPEGGR